MRRILKGKSNSNNKKTKETEEKIHKLIMQMLPAMIGMRDACGPASFAIRFHGQRHRPAHISVVVVIFCLTLKLLFIIHEKKENTEKQDEQLIFLFVCHLSDVLIV